MHSSRHQESLNLVRRWVTHHRKYGWYLHGCTGLERDGTTVLRAVSLHLRSQTTLRPACCMPAQATERSRAGTPVNSHSWAQPSRPHVKARHVSDQHAQDASTHLFRSPPVIPLLSAEASDVGEQREAAPTEPYPKSWPEEAWSKIKSSLLHNAKFWGGLLSSKGNQNNDFLSHYLTPGTVLWAWHVLPHWTLPATQSSRLLLKSTPRLLAHDCVHVRVTQSPAWRLQTALLQRKEDYVCA